MLAGLNMHFHKDNIKVDVKILLWAAEKRLSKYEQKNMGVSLKWIN